MPFRFSIEMKRFSRVAAILCFSPGILFATAAAHDPVHDLLIHIGITILTAALFAYLGNLLRQPLILAYLAAGVVLGPNVGFGVIQSEKDISTISEIGLILLLFMIGMEIDLKKIKASTNLMVAHLPAGHQGRGGAVRGAVAKWPFGRQPGFVISNRLAGKDLQRR